jgi:ferrous iron transport protein A
MNMAIDRIETLDSLPAGHKARIIAVDWAALVADEAQRLKALGVDVGAVISVAHRGVFAGRDPVAISIGRMTVALRRFHAQAIAVERL